MKPKEKIILLVREDLKRSWGRALKRLKQKLFFYHKPQHAAEAVLEDPPDLLVLQESLAPEIVYDLTKTLKTNLNLSFLPVILVLEEEKILKDWEDLPADDFVTEKASGEEVLSRIELAFARVHRSADNNPLTGLPGNTTILRAIENKIQEGKEVAVCYLDLDHFKPFNDRYGFARGDEILRMVARVLSNVVFARYGSEGFVGHVGGDDFVFICPLDGIEETCQEIIRDYEALLPSFIDPEDWERGYFKERDRQGKLKKFSFPSISIAVVPVRPGRFKHYGEVSAVAAQIKKIVKAMPGNSYFIDRRDQDVSG